MKDSEVIILLLQIINNNGNIGSIIRSGYSHQFIVARLKEFNVKGFIKYTNKRLVLTDLGLNYLANLNKKMNRRGLYKYISPSIEFRCEKMSIQDIYLPLYKIKGG